MYSCEAFRMQCLRLFAGMFYIFFFITAMFNQTKCLTEISVSCVKHPVSEDTLFVVVGFANAYEKGC